MSPRTSARLLSLFAASTLSFPLLTGCGMGHIDTTTPSAGFHGKVFGGQQPIGQSTITVWQAGVTTEGTGYGLDATQLDQVQSDDNGNFTFPANDYNCPTPDTQVYITAAGGNPIPGVANPNVLLAAGLGNCSSAQQQFVIINEVTTAATAYALGQFFTTNYTSDSNNSFGTVPDDLGYFTLSNTHTIPMLVDLPSGTARPSSNGITREDALLNTVANILAACVNDASPFNKCAQIFNDTQDDFNDAPTNTLQAAVSIALRPSQNVTRLFNMSVGTAPFTGLPAQPSDFSLAIAYTSPNFGLAINAGLPGGSSSSIDIDSNGRVFFPSNASGQTGLGYFDPSLDSFGSLQLAGMLTTPQYLALDTNNNIFETDLGSGNMAMLLSDLSGSKFPVDTNTAGSSAITVPQSGPVTVAETTTAGDNYLLTTLPAGPTQIIGQLAAPATGVTMLEEPTGPLVFAMIGSASTPCSLEEFSSDNDSGVYAPGVLLSSTTSSNCLSGGIVAIGIPGSGGIAIGVASGANEGCLPLAGPCTDQPSFNNPQAIAVDGAAVLWIANAGNTSVLAETSTAQAYVHPATLPAPYGLAIDGSGNVWVSNAGCVTTTTPCTPGPFTLTEFIGAAAPAITPLSAQQYGTFASTKPHAVRSHPVSANTLFGASSSQAPLSMAGKSTASIPWLSH
jgi:streptogramin lyase